MNGSKPSLLTPNVRSNARYDLISSKYRGVTAAERDAAQAAIDAIDALQWCIDRLYIVRRLSWLAESIVNDVVKERRTLTPAEHKDLKEAIDDANDFIQEVD